MACGGHGSRKRAEPQKALVVSLRRQAARFKAGEGRLGSQDRSNPAPHVGRRHDLPMGCSTAGCRAGLIKEKYEMQVG